MFSEKVKDLELQLSKKQCNKNENKEIDFKVLGLDFEKKINELVEENYELKNKNTYLQSQI